MQQVNIVLDLYSSVVCLILFVHLCFSKRGKSRLRIYFALICLFNALMSLADITDWACSGLAQPWCHTALSIGMPLYYFVSGPLLLAFSRYVIAYLAPQVKVRRWFVILPAILCAVQMLCSLLSVWNGMYFTITAENVYLRGEWFWLSQAVPLSIYALNFIMLICYRRFLVRKDILWLSSYTILPLVANAIQMLSYGVALLNAGITMAILLIFINIQSEQEISLERQEKKLVEASIETMLSQIQPHFLYNTLTTIRQLCDEDPQLAKDSIRDFAHFLRANMDSLNSKAPIPFERELQHVEHYLNLEKQRFMDRLCVNYFIGVAAFSLPPLTLQPLVENAVRHGVTMREEGGTVTITTRETAADFVITVADDGVGFSEHDLPDTSRSHMGIQNVRDRLRMICAGTLTITSTLQQGTTATITIPKEVDTA